MGLGKTLTALAYVASTQKRALVVCPKRVVDQWVKEASSAFPMYFQGRTVVLGSSIKTGEEKGMRGILEQANLVCVNYESFKRFAPMLKPGLDTIILDESQKIKNPKSKRTKLLLEHKDSYQHRILLSGTPLKNRVEEFQTQLDFLGYEGAYDIDTTMSPGKLWNTLAELNIYLRRSIAAEFPHLRFNDPEICEVQGASDDLRMIEGGFEIQMQGDDGRALREIVAETLAATALFKAPSTADLCAEVLRKATDDKMVVFTERKACSKLLYDSIEQQAPDVGALLHNGNFSDSDRLSILEQFRDPNSGKRVLVTTRQSMAEGVNLQCANRVIFNDLPWTPADISQAAARTKRLNQTKEVSEYWIIADTEFDENLMSILQEKRRLVQVFMDGKNNKMSQEEQQWMHKTVSIREIIYGPGFKKKPKGGR